MISNGTQTLNKNQKLKNKIENDWRESIHLMKISRYRIPDQCCQPNMKSILKLFNTTFSTRFYRPHQSRVLKLFLVKTCVNMYVEVKNIQTDVTNVIESGSNNTADLTGSSFLKFLKLSNFEFGAHIQRIRIWTSLHFGGDRKSNLS